MALRMYVRYVTYDRGMGDQAETIGTIELRQNLASVMRKVEYGGVVYAVTSNSKPSVEIVPTGTWQAYQRLVASGQAVAE